MTKKWGSIGSPKSKKRKNFLARISKLAHPPYGYKSKRAMLLDRAKKAKYRPAKTYKVGIGNRGDWDAKLYRVV